MVTKNVINIQILVVWFVKNYKLPRMNKTEKKKEDKFVQSLIRDCRLRCFLPLSPVDPVCNIITTHQASVRCGVVRS